MTIKEISYFPFSLTLKSPFNYFSSVINERHGFILKCYDEKGNVGFGECSPLPGFSKETLNDAENEIKNIISQFTGKNVLPDFNELKSLSTGTINLASVRYGFEQSLFNLIAKADSSFITRNFPDHKNYIDVNAVIGIDEVESVITKVKTKLMDGYKTIKLKIGREDPFDDFYLIVTIRDSIGFDYKLRLDANKKWSADEAIEYLNRLFEFDIEYIEEPCEFVPSTFRTCEETQIPAALDESIESIDQVRDLMNSSAIQFIVLKPMIIGGFFTVVDLIKESDKANKKIIISSAFESAIGKSGLVFLSSLTRHISAHGLDTSEFFVNNICDDPYPVRSGKIKFEAANYPPNFSLQ